MKSKLQTRAEKIANEFINLGCKPIVIEFAGIPKAGKTTILNQLQAFLKRCGFKAEIVVERASVCPIRDKKHSNFNVWTACTTLSHVLEKTQDPPISEDPHILILDRGLFDSLCWLEMMVKLERLREDDFAIIDKFLRIKDWRKRISAVVVMTSTPEDAMEREKGFLPVVGAEGSIMNNKVLAKMLETTKNNIDRLKGDFKIFHVDTSLSDTKNNPKKTAELVAEFVLTLIEDVIQEDILYLPKQNLLPFFKDKKIISANDASNLVDLFINKGSYKPRKKVEKDMNLIQALPIAIIKNRSGEVLRLKRKEKSDKNILHNEFVIWAGGHVRKEDTSNGNPIIQCVLRELKEELRLCINESNIKLMGSIYADLGSSTSKHVALVYEWTAETDEVAIVLGHEEFYERRGTSLSGKFINAEELANAINSGNIKEEWSDIIAREYLIKDKYDLSKKLF